LIGCTAKISAADGRADWGDRRDGRWRCHPGSITVPVMVPSATVRGYR